MRSLIAGPRNPQASFGGTLSCAEKFRKILRELRLNLPRCGIEFRSSFWWWRDLWWGIFWG
jgi:hypothetical protein